MIGSFFSPSAHAMDEKPGEKPISQKIFEKNNLLQENHEKNKNIILNKIKPSEYGNNEVEKKEAANILIEHGKKRFCRKFLKVKI